MIFLNVDTSNNYVYIYKLMLKNKVELRSIYIDQLGSSDYF
jgi:hypothetical protein